MRKMRHETSSSGSDEGLGVNIRSIVIVAVLMMLMLFAIHCTKREGASSAFDS